MNSIRRNLILILLLFSVARLFAQDSIQKNKISRIWVSLNIEPFKIEGTLYSVNDSSIVVSNFKTSQDFKTNYFERLELNYAYIKEIKVRKRNSVANGVWIGALSGFVIGGIIGLLSEDDPPCPPNTFICIRMSQESKAVAAMVPLTISGAGLGALMGTIKVKIYINGSKDQFYNHRSQLENYALKKN